MHRANAEAVRRRFNSLRTFARARAPAPGPHMDMLTGSFYAQRKNPIMLPDSLGNDNQNQKEGREGAP